MNDIFILHENEEWVVPLRAEFAKRGVEVKTWFLDEGVVEYDNQPAPGVYYNRMSASSHTRGHRFAPELTRMALTWLEGSQREDVKVVNGTDALYLEVCKLSQYRALEQAGLRVPRTRAVVGKEQVVPAARDFDQWPVILKPNRGGKGLGVIKFESTAELETYLASEDYSSPLDGIWLLQEYVQPASPHITRCEFVGQRFVYAVQVDTSGGFELCPADVCAVGDSACPVGEQNATPAKFQITDTYNNHAIIEQLEGFLAQSKVDIAGIEMIENSQGELYVYDVNTNTNYNGEAESASGTGVTGMGAVADYLISLAKA